MPSLVGTQAKVVINASYIIKSYLWDTSRGTNIVHLFGGEIPLKIEVKEINEHIFIFDFQNSTYFAEKLTKL